MNKRAYLVAVVKAEVRAKMAIQRFEKEFETNGNPNQRGGSPTVRQNNTPTGNVPQQPGYGG